jgi:hypothetical protein
MNARDEIASIAERVASVRKQLGAPGDYGYETPAGIALQAFYGLANQCSRALAESSAMAEQADARLIAAAPELLAALEGLVSSFEKHRPKELWDAARAAIAMATQP